MPMNTEKPEGVASICIIADDMIKASVQADEARDGKGPSRKL